MDGKSVRDKLVGPDSERAVSPVIGVILMVAITVILAAVIAAFVLDLGQGQSASPQAGISFDHNSGGGNITVTVTKVQRADDLKMVCDGTEYNQLEATVGNSTVVEYGGSGGGGVNLSDCDSNAIQIVGEYEGSESVITTFDDHV